MPFIHANTDGKDTAQCSLILPGDYSNDDDVAQKCSSLSVAYLDVYSHLRVIAQLGSQHQKNERLSRAQLAFILRAYLFIVCN